MGHRISESQIAAFRLARHHLTDHPADERRAPLTGVCGDVCGVQAQVMSAAETSLWARRPGTTREELRAALSDHRTLVRTACMRETLHLVPAADFGIITAALRTSRSRRTLQIMARYGVSPEDTRRVTDAVMEALSAGPLEKRELTAHVLGRNLVRGRSRKWFELSSWGVARRAIVEGRVCYGPARGGDARLVLADQWLGKQEAVPEQEAQRVLLRRYLSAYGPATVRDFAKWSGLAMNEAQAAWAAAAEEFAEVAVEHGTASVLRRDLESLRHSSLDRQVVRLLPNFDAYLLAHASKDHLVERTAYKRVYRNQGWISAVVLVDGRVAGTWSTLRRARRLVFEIAPFATFSKRVGAKVESECAGLAEFLGLAWDMDVAQS
ncbi:MAG TPA: winged helix DNA-binding domain-containing protein [Terriglobia bacterium]|nr:winged helix DNA-binding domain-containing protein [Terriglobia bacterium]